MANDIICGSYGCVIKSFVSCDIPNIQKSANDLYISKIFDSKTNWNTEILLNKRIQQIDVNNDFTIKMVHYCHLNDKKSSAFKVMRNSGKYSIVYLYGGEDLDIFISSDNLLHDFNILNFLRSFINIFDGIVKLNENGLVHFDIKPDNILYDKANNRFTLIDFGLMQKKEDILTTNILGHFYKKQFFYYPSELNIFSYLVFDKSTSINIKVLNINGFIYKLDELYNDIHKHAIRNPNLATLLTLLLSIINKIKEQFENFANFLSYFDDIIAKLNKTLFKTSVVNKEYKNICKTTSNDILSKVDVYMLGIALFSMLLKIIRKLLEANIIDSILLIPHELFNLISNMICFNPCDRIDIETARDEYKKILGI